MKQCPRCASFLSETSDRCGVCGQLLSSWSENRSTLSSYNQKLPGPTVIESELTSEILDVVQELAVKLNSRDIHASDVMWLPDNNQPDVPAFTRQHKLVLSMNLMDKLALAEWRALIASSMIFISKFRTRRRLGNLVLAIAPITCFAIFLWIYLPLIPILLPAGAPSGVVKTYGQLLIPIGFGIFILCSIAMTPYTKRLKRLADDYTCQYLAGRDDLLEALKKIQKFDPPKLPLIQKLILRIYPLPERIHNLSSDFEDFKSK